MTAWLSILGAVFAIGGMGCATAPVRGDAEPVPLGQWCESMADSVCTRLADACMNGATAMVDACTEQAARSCIARRDASGPSGRNGADQRACLSAMTALSCSEIGRAVGQMRFGKGALKGCAVEQDPASD